MTFYDSIYREGKNSNHCNWYNKFKTFESTQNIEIFVLYLICHIDHNKLENELCHEQKRKTSNHILINRRKLIQSTYVLSLEQYEKKYD
jgi:hypothetical protein